MTLDIGKWWRRLLTLGVLALSLLLVGASVAVLTVQWALWRKVEAIEQNDLKLLELRLNKLEKDYAVINDRIERCEP